MVDGSRNGKLEGACCVICCAAHTGAGNGEAGGGGGTAGAASGFCGECAGGPQGTPFLCAPTGSPSDDADGDFSGGLQGTLLHNAAWLAPLELRAGEGRVPRSCCKIGTCFGGGEEQDGSSVLGARSVKVEALPPPTSEVVFCAGAQRDRSMASLKSARSAAEAPDDWFPSMPLRWRPDVCIAFMRSITPRVMPSRAKLR